MRYWFIKFCLIELCVFRHGVSAVILHKHCIVSSNAVGTDFFNPLVYRRDQKDTMNSQSAEWRKSIGNIAIVATNYSFAKLRSHKVKIREQKKLILFHSASFSLSLRHFFSVLFFIAVIENHWPIKRRWTINFCIAFSRPLERSTISFCHLAAKHCRR